MDRELYDRARAARQHAHAPYSRFLVGVALRTESGAVHAGCNVENASYPEGWCAETSAIASMITAGKTPADRRIAEVVVTADKIGGNLTTPCGGCRQRLAEFSGPDTIVHVSDPQGDSKTYRMRELLPAAFVLDAK
jgi:cytidine deaminase